MNKVIDFCRQRQIPYETDASLARCCTFRIGGSASCLIRPRSADEFCDLLVFFRRTEQRFRVIGRGSNLLFSDRHIDFPIVCTTQMTDLAYSDGSWRAACGVSLRQLILTAAGQGFGGLEELYGIPGTVGGAVFMNAGAYDGEMRNIVQESTYLDTTDGTLHTLHQDEHAFGYRDSIYRHHPDWILISVKLALQPGDKEAIGAKMEDFWSRRVAKQPLDYPSAGSVFKRYPGRYTAQMIDEAGLKGAMVGGAQVSEKHAGFIINKGNATSADVLTLIEKIRQTLHDKYGIWIECELIRYPK